MDDIIDIYDPIYRDTNHLLLIISIVLITILISLVIFFVIKKIKNKVIVKTPEELYKNTLDEYLNLQNSLTELSTTEYSSKTTYLFKEYLSQLYNYDFLSTTNFEMLSKLSELNEVIQPEFSEYFLNILEPCQFGKLEIDKDKKNIIIKTCVDIITDLYSKTLEVKND